MHGCLSHSKTHRTIRKASCLVVCCLLFHPSLHPVDRWSCLFTRLLNPYLRLTKSDIGDPVFSATSRWKMNKDLRHSDRQCYRIPFKAWILSTIFFCDDTSKISVPVSKNLCRWNRDLECGTGSCPEPDNSNLHLHSQFLINIDFSVILPSALRLSIKTSFNITNLCYVLHAFPRVGLTL